MQEVSITLEQTWETLDRAIDYFLDIVLDLKALKRLPEPPTDLYITLEGVELPDNFYDKLKIKITNL